MVDQRLDSFRVRQSFDRAAADYEANAVLQREVGERLLERLGYLDIDPSCILDLGCGTGLQAGALKERYQSAAVIAADFAPAMLKQVRKHSRWRRPLLPVGADALKLPFAARSADLIFSNLAMQWCDTLPDLFNECRRVLRPGGLLLFSTFGPDTLHELRNAWGAVDRQVHVNQFLDMHDIGDFLLLAGFANPVMDAERICLEYGTVGQLMKELKAIGAHNLNAGRPAGLTGRSKMQAMVRHYDQFRRNDRYPATYEVLYGTAWEPAEGQPRRVGDGEVVHFSVEHLKGSRRG